MKTKHESYWHTMWRRFCKHRLGFWGLCIVILFCLIGIYAPFLASSKPFFVVYDGVSYFPLFRYLFYPGFFTKRLDIFYNLLIFTLPLGLLSIWLLKGNIRKISVAILILGQFLLFFYLVYFPLKDPATDIALNQERREALKQMGPNPPLSWQFDLKYMNSYAKLNLLLKFQQSEEQHKRLLPYAEKYSQLITQNWLANAIRKKKELLIKNNIPIPSDQELEKQVFLAEAPESVKNVTMPTLWQIAQDHEKKEISRLQSIIAEQVAQGDTHSPTYLNAKENLQYILDRQQWLNEQSAKLHNKIMPLLSPFHWEDDAGGQQALNYVIPWWEVTRIDRKDLLAALIFGVRISLTVGIISVALAMAIGIPIGAFAGFYGGSLDIVVCRLLEIWEAMPVFFMLLMVVGILQSKSIFVVTAVIGFFSWTHFSRYIRGEFFKQRNLPYVEACQALGFRDRYIMFKHILPNAIPPVLTLLPFAIMGAITSEAGLSFLGLGEEGSCSWGVLMDEGRTAFPQESYLLWPPAILLTILLVAIALVGDSMRDTLDPKRE